MTKPELILGTAEFDLQGYALRKCPPLDEVVRILNLAWESGIRTIDTSDRYHCEYAMKWFRGFDLIFKTRNVDELHKSNRFYHYTQKEDRLENVSRASVYTKAQIPSRITGREQVIIPYNINNTEFADIEWPENTYVRSVFDRGILLQSGYTVKDCLSFVRRANPKGVIIGVNSVRELREILDAWNSLT